MNMSFLKHISKEKCVIITIESKQSVIDCVHIIILQIRSLNFTKEIQNRSMSEDFIRYYVELNIKFFFNFYMYIIEMQKKLKLARWNGFYPRLNSKKCVKAYMNPSL